ncbi:MAG: hypothetical protein Q7T54_02555 [Candidatus Levybacteria bacterium]|nr:hypothetical protein [Candidatus Levybacteria bacterium]
MKERVTQFFQDLPDEGIALQGTNLARAKSIQENGLIPNSLVGLDSNIWYNVQPPSMNPTLFWDIMREINSHVRECIKFADRAAKLDSYSYGNLSESSIPAIIVFKPLEKFDRTSMALKSAPYPMTRRETKPIPKENVFGVINLGRNNTQAKEVITQVVELFRHSRPQLLAQG